MSSQIDWVQEVYGPLAKRSSEGGRFTRSDVDELLSKAWATTGGIVDRWQRFDPPP